MKSCSVKSAQAMKELRSCDCSEADYANLKLQYEQKGPFSNTYFRCLPNGKFKKTVHCLLVSKLSILVF